MIYQRRGAHFQNPNPTFKKTGFHFVSDAERRLWAGERGDAGRERELEKDTTNSPGWRARRQKGESGRRFLKRRSEKPHGCSDRTINIDSKTINLACSYHSLHQADSRDQVSGVSATLLVGRLGGFVFAPFDIFTPLRGQRFTSTSTDDVGWLVGWVGGCHCRRRPAAAPSRGCGGGEGVKRGV